MSDALDRATHDWQWCPVCCVPLERAVAPVFELRHVGGSPLCNGAVAALRASQAEQERLREALWDEPQLQLTEASATLDNVGAKFGDGTLSLVDRIKDLAAQRDAESRKVASGAAREAALREALTFTKAKLEILLSTHLCIDHGAGDCSDVDGAREALRHARATLAGAATK